MEKKTIGQFIAALRKANGMTQRELSEKLNVSDKAVSRWERDENAPDLTLIPVIAEIFGVTSDEILRGERRNGTAPDTPEPSPKGAKQIERLLNSTLNTFTIRSVITVGIAALGLLGAILCNIGFNRAYIGFIVGCILYLIATIFGIVFINSALNAVSNSDIATEEANNCKKTLLRRSFWLFSFIGILFAVSLPLIYIPWDAYLGVTAETWLKHGAILLAATLILTALLKGILSFFGEKTGFIPMTAPEKEKSSAKRRLKLKYSAILGAILAVTCIFQWGFNQFIRIEHVMDGTKLHGAEEFMEFMATPDDGNDGPFLWESDRVVVTQWGYETEMEWTETMYAENGDVWFEYLCRRDSVSEIHVEYTDDDAVFTTYSYADFRTFRNFKELINNAFVFVYVAEAAIMLLIMKKALSNLRKGC